MNSQAHFPGIAQMRPLAGLMVRHDHGVTECIVSTAVHHIFIRKSQNGMTGSLTDECEESAIFILAYFSPEAEVTHVIGNSVRMEVNPLTQRENLMRQQPI
ncbi:TPA: hypothetical protein ACTALY_003427 [Salmonella enterica subsp. enterica serovar Muenchen]|nr:hypothetical protein [Salmonella enterica subsp. enterica serovar Muenchen]HEC8371440.1 hypothetical protein [Salmonella enterica subsp. enterica serovar Muenchen]HEC9709952.1 hypothetical protein [Salmonella enterica subsp. enterica serovar Muenchen]HED0221188.1 hypothetical protein [Salmonella enterica subsp. enterica serovar Muenchen]